MEWIWVLIIAAAILVFIISAATKTQSQTLNEKFVSLGKLSGKTLQEIESVVGVANSVSSTIGAGGETIFIYQWIQTAYHIVLLFDENKICLGVSSETRIDESNL
jgi:hypothetical protein